MDRASVVITFDYFVCSINSSRKLDRTQSLDPIEEYDSINHQTQSER